MLCLSNLSRAASLLRQQKESYRLSKAMIEKVAGMALDPDTRVRLLHGHAAAASRVQESSEAETTYREALALALTTWDEEHPTVTQIRANLAFFLVATNRVAEGEGMLRESLDRHRKTWGENHSSTLHLTVLLVDCLQQAKKHREALELVSAGFARAAQHLGPRHRVTLDLGSRIVSPRRDSVPTSWSAAARSSEWTTRSR